MGRKSARRIQNGLRKPGRLKNKISIGNAGGFFSLNISIICVKNSYINTFTKKVSYVVSQQARSYIICKCRSRLRATFFIFKKIWRYKGKNEKSQRITFIVLLTVGVRGCCSVTYLRVHHPCNEQELRKEKSPRSRTRIHGKYCRSNVCVEGIKILLLLRLRR